MAASALTGLFGGEAIFQWVSDLDFGLARAVETGFPSATLDFEMRELEHSGLARAAVSAVIGHVRTLHRKRRSAAWLSRAESDRLARLVRMLVRTRDAFDSRDKAIRWLATPNRALAGTVPLPILGSDACAIAVDAVLGRIEHGVSS